MSLQTRPWVRKLSNPRIQFSYEQEYQTALAVLGVIPQKPPTPGTAGYLVQEMEFIMDPKRDGGKMQKAVEEICDLPVVKQAVMKMIASDDPAKMEAALRCLPNLIAACLKAVSPRREEDNGKDSELKTSDLDE